MPVLSMRLTSDASENRGGGSVKCWCASSLRLSASPSLMAGRRRNPRHRVVVAAFLIEREEAVEFHHLAGWRAARAHASLPSLICRRWCVPVRPIHLARNGAGPDQLIELGLIGIEGGGAYRPAARQVGRPDSFVRFLSFLALVWYWRGASGT